MKFNTQLIVAIGIIAVLILVLGMDKDVGRYQISGTGEASVFILDTGTSQLWFRTGQVSIDLGTVQKPRLERTLLEEQANRKF